MIVVLMKSGRSVRYRQAVSVRVKRAGFLVLLTKQQNVVATLVTANVEAWFDGNRAKGIEYDEITDG